MFFKHNEKIKQRNVNIACWCTFTVWAVLLLINSFYEFFMDKEFIASSFTILVIGLVVFFVVEAFLNIYDRKSESSRNL
ncbi:hypothetical protein [Fictibacillus phosphorivorans]|jgi:FtsH-binding integral membrane protein|uniref:hypothetical protein n=1 Tax=Fictibacillus phosphorivorans TaxID=1221500 RepID=UPI001293EA2C|nr:hypothetical protein [Fictibacillus phosphorivorans]MQR94635.1 hypothetical protein [Fictibacillus phosphorivorans]